MVRFSDVDGASVTIESTWRNALGSQDAESGCQTDPVLLEDKAVQSLFTHDVSTQADLRSNVDLEEIEEDEEKAAECGFEGWEPTEGVARFLQASGELMLCELVRASKSTAFVAISEQDEGMLEEKWNLVGVLEPSAEAVNVELSCTSVSWNSAGSKVCCGYGSVTEYAWSESPGLVRVWHIFGGGKQVQETALETPSGTMTLAFHPSYPATFATGGFNGQVMLWDLNVQDSLIAFSHVESYTHRDPVVAVAWTNRKGAVQLVSLSAEGRILLWDPDSYKDAHMKLQVPLTGITLSRSTTSEILGGKTLAQAQLQQNTLLVGGEGGSVCRCSLPIRGKTTKALEHWTPQAREALLHVSDRESLKRKAETCAARKNHGKVLATDVFGSTVSDIKLFPPGIRLHYEPHIGPVYCIDASPFHRNLFLSGGADGQIRLYSLLQSDPICIFQPGPESSSIHSVKWSPTRPNVFAACSSLGELFVFDLLEDASSHVLEIPAQKDTCESGYLSLSFNTKTRGLIATGDSSGRVNVYKLPWKLSNKQPNELEALRSLANLHPPHDIPES